MKTLLTSGCTNQRGAGHGLKGAIQKREKMKRHKRNKKATTSANVMAGIRINSGWLNKLAADITKIINEACP
ncbi:hypothetical protein [Citrobacter freundii]|uniref:hypothetical protein n=1 Tax=Citrobacter freundii TaxID=546 RepID=UPI00388D1183